MVADANAATTPELDILSGELVKHKSMRVREYCVTRVGSVIIRILNNNTKT